MAKKDNFSPLDFHIKLLASNNVVLVECNNYESEVFAPQIVEGRITFVNIIPNRRCCQINKTNTKNSAKKELQQATNSSNERTLASSGKLGKCLADECLTMSFPLANSTPTGIKQKQSSAGQLTSSYSCASVADSTLRTPEPVRKAAPVRSVLLETSTSNLAALKVLRIYPSPAKGKPRKVGRLVISNSVSSALNKNASLLDGNYALPCSPILPTHFRKKHKSNSALHSTPVDSVAQWQKVLTPVRTYSRKMEMPVTTKLSKKTENVQRSKFKPTFLCNPTKGLNVSQEIEIKKCKLIKDNKTKISPRSFKKQQHESLNASAIKSNLSLHPRSLGFHKPRSYLETMGLSAFDLLTSSNRNRMISRKLHEQFRRGCVNKASSTYFKYKVLSTVLPIQQDEQVLELSRTSQ